MDGGQTIADIAQAEKIISAAFRVVLLALYVKGLVTEKYLSKLMTNKFITDALDDR